MTCLMDLAGLGYDLPRWSLSVRKTMQLLKSYYPERLGLLIVYNAPAGRTFQYLWKVGRAHNVSCPMSLQATAVASVAGVRSASPQLIAARLNQFNESEAR